MVNMASAHRLKNETKPVDPYAISKVASEEVLKNL